MPYEFPPILQGKTEDAVKQIHAFLQRHIMRLNEDEQTAVPTKAAKEPTKPKTQQTPIPLTSEKVTAALGYIPGMVNPNLLDNWYFANPVNQRGFSTADNAQNYTIDRWKMAINSTGTGKTITLNSDYLTLLCSNSDTGAYVECNQYIEPDLSAQLIGKNITVSILTDSGLYSKSMKLTAGAYGNVNIGENGVCYITFPATGKGTFLARAYYGDAINIIAVKLELGSQQTLAHQDGDGNWVLNEIPDYGEQLARCQRYYYTINSESFLNGIKVPGDSFSVPLWLPVTMRSVPVLIGTLQVYSSAEGWRTTAGAAIVQKTANNYDIVDGSLSYVENTHYLVKGISAFSADL